MSTQTNDTDWTIRRHGDSWAIFKDGRPDDGSNAPNGLCGLMDHLRAMPGDILDLPDVGIASSRVPTNQERCPVTGKPIRSTSSFGSGLDARAKPADWQGVVFAPGGRRWYLHADATDMVAPRVAAALASYSSSPIPDQPADPAEWRRVVALNLLTRAFSKGGETGPLLSAWCAANAIQLLSTPGRPQRADVVERRPRGAVRG
jgi:hypothetical protein